LVITSDYMQAPQALPLLLLLCLFFLTCPASAQSKGSETRPTTVLTETTTSKPVRVDKSTAFVNGHQTKIEVLGLFKPAEIEIKAKRPAEHTADHMPMNIQVKDKNHPVLTYFEKKAKLKYRGRLYEHNDIPDIDPARVHRVNYHNLAGTEYEGQLDDYLEVILHGEEHVPHEKTVFSSESRRIAYYDVDGKIMLEQELPILRHGTFTIETLFGKEAVERYGHAKFAEGINIIRTKK
jgi:hypothetical protein